MDWLSSRTWLRLGGRQLLLGIVVILASEVRADASPAASTQPEPAGIVVLTTNVPFRQVTQAPAWVGQAGAADIELARGGRLPFQVADFTKPRRLQRGEAMWVKLSLRSHAAASEAWQLEVPLPAIDSVTLHQQDEAGRWTRQRAGDSVPMSAWAQPGRYPFFRLNLQPAKAADVFIEIRHSMALRVPLRIVGSAAHYERAQLEYLSLGVVLGAMSLLVAASLAMAVRLRDSAHACYFAFSLLALLALAATTGVASHLLWGDWVLWSDAAPGSLTLLAGAAALWLVQGLSPVVTQARWLAQSLQATAIAGVAAAAAYVVLERQDALMMLGMHLAVVAALCLYAAVLTWRRGDRPGLWMTLGAIPMVLAVALAVARGFGIPLGSWPVDYAAVLALAIELTALLAALKGRSTERWSVELRRLAGSNQDPLTGVMRSEAFTAKLRQAVLRRSKRDEGAAILLIDLANHPQILARLGTEAAEEALLRTVVKIRRLVRDVDSTGRLGEHRFGLILEGVSVRQPVSTLGSRLVALGLMAEPDRPRAAPLHLHVAAVLLTEHPGSADEVLATLSGMLDDPDPRTQRPFRLFEPDAAARPGPDRAGRPAHDAARDTRLRQDPPADVPSAAGEGA